MYTYYNELDPQFNISPSFFFFFFNLDTHPTPSPSWSPAPSIMYTFSVLRASVKTYCFIKLPTHQNNASNAKRKSPCCVRQFSCDSPFSRSRIITLAIFAPFLLLRRWVLQGRLTLHGHE